MKPLNITKPLLQYTLALMLTLCAKIIYAQHDTVLTDGYPCPTGKWKLVFFEDFNSDSVDKSKWFTYYPYTIDGSDSCAFCRLHADGGQVYIDENVEVSDGLLKLNVKRDSTVWFGKKRPYSSGMIHSKQSFSYGRYEVRCKLPKGRGLWPAIWLFGKNSAELDILEAGMQRPRIIHTSIHNYKIKKMKHLKHRRMPDLSAEFHNYVMEWDTNTVVFMLDEQVLWKFHRFTKASNNKQVKDCNLEAGEYGLEPLFPPVNERLQLILNVAVGTKTTPFTNEPDKKTIFPAVMEVEYIKIYERDR